MSRRHVETKQRVAELVAEGLNHTQIALALGVAKHTVCLSLCLHHINGINDDNRIENLAVLCPNCHSQTENFAGRNRRADAEAA